MLTQAFTSIRHGYLKAQVFGARLTLQYAVAICPPESKAALIRCLKESHDFNLRVVRMVAEKSPELDLLDSLMGISDGSQMFRAYDIMMDTFKRLTSVDHAPHSTYLVRTAKNFIRNFDELPENVAAVLNRGLKIDLAMLELNLTSFTREAALAIPSPR